MTCMLDSRSAMGQVVHFHRVGQQVAGTAHSRTRLVCGPVMIQRRTRIVAESPIGPRTYFLKFRFAPIQPYGKRLQRSGAGDDQVCVVVIIDVPCLKTETSFAFRAVDREPQPGTATGEMDADPVNGPALMDRGSFGYVVAVKITADGRAVGDAFVCGVRALRSDKDE